MDRQVAEWLGSLGLALGGAWFVIRTVGRWLGPQLDRLGDIVDVLRGTPPKGRQPGTRGLVDEVRILGEDMAEVKTEMGRVTRIVTNGMSTNVARGVELAEKASVDAEAAKQDAAAAKEAARVAADNAERVVAGLDSLGAEVGRLSQRMREKRDVADAVIDKIAETLMREDDDGAGGET